MDQAAINQLGDEFYEASLDRAVVEPPSSRFSGMTVDDAYRVAERTLARRVAAGDTLVGRKIGLTNKMVQEYLGVDEPDVGNLTGDMQYEDGADVPISQRLIQPKVEGEIAFVLRSGLSGPRVTESDVLDATEYVAPCFEIVDSRVRDWQIRIEDTVADNASSGLFVVGNEQANPRDLDLSACEMALRADGEVVAEGIGAAALGSPLTCVAWLANMLSAFGDVLQPGDVILSGSLTPVLPATPGAEMSISVTGIGSASLRFT